MRIAAAIILALLALLPATAPAGELADYFRSELYRELVLSQWGKQAMELCGSHERPETLTLVGQAIYEAPKFVNGRLYSGAWMHRYRGPACGHTQIFNFLFVAQDGSLVFRNLLPGTSQTSAQLQSDAMPAARARIRRDLPDCELFVPLGAEIIGSDPRGAWAELWMFEACGKKIPVTMVFTPDGKGGTFFNAK